jgi:hypothetical protein
MQLPRDAGCQADSVLTQLWLQLENSTASGIRAAARAASAGESGAEEHATLANR